MLWSVAPAFAKTPAGNCLHHCRPVGMPSSLLKELHQPLTIMKWSMTQVELHCVDQPMSRLGRLLLGLPERFSAALEIGQLLESLFEPSF
jgi:hypothetical protein